MDPHLIAAALAVAVVLSAAMWLADQARDERSSGVREQQEPPADAALAAAQLTVAWAAGTRADWDRHVRPVLAREFEAVVGGRRSVGARARTGELMFGPRLWRLVDPDTPFTSGRDRPGPGRESLRQILQRLESA